MSIEKRPRVRFRLVEYSRSGDKVTHEYSPEELVTAVIAHTASTPIASMPPIRQEAATPQTCHRATQAILASALPTLPVRVTNVDVKEDEGEKTIIIEYLKEQNRSKENIEEIIESLKRGALTLEQFERLWSIAIETVQPIDVKLGEGGEVKIGRVKLRIEKDTLVIEVYEDK